MDDDAAPTKKLTGRDRHLKLRNVEIFLDAARLGNLAAAAKSLGLSPTSVSDAIAALERDLGQGVVLFDRSNAGSTLTRTGELLAREGVGLLRAEATVRQAIADHLSAADPRRGQRVTVAYEPLLTGIVTNATFAVLYKLEAKVFAVEAIETDTDTVAEKVGRGEADLGLSWLPPANTESVDIYPIASSPLVAVVSARGYLAHSPDFYLDKLKKEHLALPSKRSTSPGQRYLRQVVDEYFAEHGVEPGCLKFESHSTASILALVRTGEAMTITYAAAVHEDLNSQPGAAQHTDLLNKPLDPPPNRNAILVAMLRKGTRPSIGAYSFTTALIRMNKLDGAPPLPEAYTPKLEEGEDLPRFLDT